MEQHTTIKHRIQKSSKLNFHTTFNYLLYFIFSCRESKVLDVLMAMLMAPGSTVWCNNDTKECFLWEEASDKEEMKNLFDVQNHILKALETLIVGNYDTEMYFGDVERLSSTLPNCVDTQQNDHSVANFAWPYMSDAGFAWPRSDKDNANAKQVS
jgi:hypothetical protein